MAKPLTEKWCSVCGKISWDSDFGSYHERHDDPKTGKSVPCDTNGRSETTQRPD